VPFRRELFKDMPQADVEATVRVLMKLDQVLAERNAS
jgi:MarR family transcriptional regulator for hemolysin